MTPIDTLRERGWLLEARLEAGACGLALEDTFASPASRRVTRARHAVWRRLRALYRAPLEDLGALWGAHPSSVWAGIKSAERRAAA